MGTLAAWVLAVDLFVEAHHRLQRTRGSWVWLALMPVLLLFLVAYTRIKAHGLAEEHYLIVLIGVWAFFSLACAFGGR